MTHNTYRTRDRGGWLGLLVKRPERKIIGRLQRKRSGRVVYGWIYGRAQRVKVFVLHNAHEEA